MFKNVLPQNHYHLRTSREAKFKTFSIDGTENHQDPWIRNSIEIGWEVSTRASKISGISSSSIDSKCSNKMLKNLSNINSNGNNNNVITRIQDSSVTINSAIDNMALASNIKCSIVTNSKTNHLHNLHMKIFKMLIIKWTESRWINERNSLKISFTFQRNSSQTSIPNNMDKTEIAANRKILDSSTLFLEVDLIINKRWDPNLTAMPPFPFPTSSDTILGHEASFRGQTSFFVQAGQPNIWPANTLHMDHSTKVRNSLFMESILIWLPIPWTLKGSSSCPGVITRTGLLPMVAMGILLRFNPKPNFLTIYRIRITETTSFRMEDTPAVRNLRGCLKTLRDNRCQEMTTVVELAGATTASNRK